jgi:beta-lactamase regulating signal transducer with metallopeptidase domain
MEKDLITGAVGTTLGIVGTATQTNEVLQTISLIITIIGAVISMIVVPILSWYIKAKKDGKITPDEVKEGVEILKDGLEKTNDEIKENKGD